MPIGYFSEGNTRYVLEARESNGACVYRKFTNEDRWNYLFGLIPSTECGIHFRSRPIDSDKDKRLSLIARPNVCTYISREYCKLQGKDPIPERRMNRKILSRHGRPGAVQQTFQDRVLMPPQLLEFVDPETLEGQLRPSRDSLKISDELRAEMLANSTLPSAEKAPEGFNLEDWIAGGDFEIPEEILLSKPEGPDMTPSEAAASGSAKGFEDQLVEFGERDESRSERQTREGKAVS